MGRRLRLPAAVLVALGGALMLPLTAQAHALAQSSDPADGTILQQAPALVRITFGEAPDPKLSSIRILDTSGKEYQQGSPQAVPGDPKQLKQAMGLAPKGVYTVAWRTISSVDGHLASGSFAFGVGVSPAGAGTTSPSPTTPTSQLTPLGVAGRWVLFIGLVAMLGTVFVGLVAFREPPPSTLPVAIGATLVALVGTAMVIEAQRADAGVTYTQLLATSTGRIVAWRIAPAVWMAIGVALAAASRDGVRRVAIAIAGIAAALAMLADVSASHAAAADLPLLNGLVQWVHVLAAGIWIGGLFALLLGLRGAESGNKGRAVKRFSTVAGVALVTVALTGTIRAVVEIGAWDRLMTTTFGQLVIVKVALLLALASLGAVNRYRNVPAALRRLRPLRRVGTAEVLLGAGAMLTAAGLVNVPPPAYAAPPPAAPPQVVASGADFGTTVKARLEVSPGSAGFNQFTLHVADFDSGRPTTADAVTLKFTLPARPDVGSTTLDLKRTGDGIYRADGTNLSLDGAWRIDVLVQRGAQSVQVTLNLQTRAVPPQIDVNRVPGQLTIYTIHIGQGRSVQVYLDPEKPGANEFHTTFFDASGNELPVDRATIATTPPGGQTVVLPVRELEAGHFVADVNVSKGRTGFDISGTARTGEQLNTHIDIDLGS